MVPAEADAEAAADAGSALREQIAVRMDKRARLIEAGMTPYGGRFARTHAVNEVLGGFDELEGQVVSVAGRIRTLRRQGRVAFIDVQDDGARMQLFCRANSL